MSIKKFLFITLIALTILASFNAVSAGLFDFLDNNEPQDDILSTEYFDLNITDSSYDVTLEDSDLEGYNFIETTNFYITIDITPLNDTVRKEILNHNNATQLELYFTEDSLFLYGPDLKKTAFDIENDTLIIRGTYTEYTDGISGRFASASTSGPISGCELDLVDYDFGYYYIDASNNNSTSQ